MSPTNSERPQPDDAICAYRGMRKTHERKDYVTLLQELEELESLKAYDAAKSSGDEAIPLDQALAEIEECR